MPAESEVQSLCTEVAEALAAAGNYLLADQILASLVKAGCLTDEKGVLGQIYMRMLAQRHDLALELGDSAFERNARFFRVAFLLAQLYELAGDPGQAMRWYENALRVAESADWRDEAVASHQRLEKKRLLDLHVMDVTSMAIRA